MRTIGTYQQTTPSVIGVLRRSFPRPAPALTTQVCSITGLIKEKLHLTELYTVLCTSILYNTLNKVFSFIIMMINFIQ